MVRIMSDILQYSVIAVFILLAYMLAKILDTLGRIANLLEQFRTERAFDSITIKEMNSNVVNVADKLYYISNAFNAKEISEEKNKRMAEKRARIWAENHAEQIRLRQGNG